MAVNPYEIPKKTWMTVPLIHGYPMLWHMMAHVYRDKKEGKK